MIFVGASIVRYAPLQIIVLEILDNIINGSTRHICPVMCQYTNCNTWNIQIRFNNQVVQFLTDIVCPTLNHNIIIIAH